ncbi:hypothetical protein ACET3X_003516 [Alternaria dauci]|uniref:Uncharacterized protein n=1 Tax=Alternaria dauci TaxID=48095 RepID=A0ABR3UT25_9PLEO
MDSKAVVTTGQHLTGPKTDSPVGTTAMNGRLTIIYKDVKPLVPGRKTVFNLSAELRNKIYGLALDKDYQRVPLNRYHLNKPDLFVSLLQTCSRVYQEARSYMADNQVVYIPVMAGIRFDYGGELKEDYGLSRETTDTIAASLMDFMKVHFHLHIDILTRTNLQVYTTRYGPGARRYQVDALIDGNGEEYNPSTLLDALHEAIKQYKPHSWDLYMKHGLGKRRSIVHLDHLLSLWPKLSDDHACLPIAALQDLVDLLAKDTMTDWQIRYYVPTGQAGVETSYGNTTDADGEEGMPELIRDAELAQLRRYAAMHGQGHITVVAEVYGDNTGWELGDELHSVTRHRSPVTEFWPNLDFDPSEYEFSLGNHYQKRHRAHMVFAHFDDEVLEAMEKDRGRRVRWMNELQRRDDEAEAERVQKEKEEKEAQTEMERLEARFGDMPALG